MTEAAVGDRVGWWFGPGSYAERVVIDADQTFRLPVDRAFGLPGAGPRERADELPGDGHRLCGGAHAEVVGEKLGQAEVEHLRLARGVDTHVAGLVGESAEHFPAKRVEQLAAARVGVDDDPVGA